MIRSRVWVGPITVASRLINCTCNSPRQKAQVTCAYIHLAFFVFVFVCQHDDNNNNNSNLLFRAHTVAMLYS